MFDGWVEGKVVKLTDDELAYTWKPNNWGENTRASEVHYKLVGVDHGTEVFITHTGLPTKEEVEGIKQVGIKTFLG